MDNTFNIHEAKTHLSKLIEKTQQGESFVISKSGRPVARLVPVSSTTSQQKRIGFLKGELKVPDDFDQMGNEVLVSLFNGNEE